MRDRAKHKALKIFYGILALGWRGAASHWSRYNTAYMILAAIATPLVVSVHTVVSFDFATSIVPGWHTTVFPPYFVAGAVFAGFAMVLTLTIPLRRIYNLQGMITARHLDNMAKITLVTGLVVGYGYFMEVFIGWYSGSMYEIYMLNNRFVGPYAPTYWALILCNVLTIQLLWFRWVRYNEVMLFIISLIVGVGMWLERFVIIVTSLHRDFLPSSWGMFSGTFWDWSLYIGSMGLFLVMMFIFIRTLPMISIFEMKELLHAKSHGHGHSSEQVAETGA
jgi:molybdopterin-containing oxidoreductase family membrane subunit